MLDCTPTRYGCSNVGVVWVGNLMTCHAGADDVAVDNLLHVYIATAGLT